MIDRRREARSEVADIRRGGVREAGGVILLTLSTILALLWAIVLVTHFHGTLSGVGQSLWLTR